MALTRHRSIPLQTWILGAAVGSGVTALFYFNNNHRDSVQLNAIKKERAQSVLLSLDQNSDGKIDISEFQKPTAESIGQRWHVVQMNTFALNLDTPSGTSIALPNQTDIDAFQLGYVFACLDRDTSGTLSFGEVYETDFVQNTLMRD